MRQLASIQVIRDIKPIKDADNIEVVSILGWNVVSKKGEFSLGDKCVYFEVDSFLPIEERYEFLRGSSYRKNDFVGEGFRLKTIRLRGQLSQGLALPLQEFTEISEEVAIVGTEVTELLGIKKWELPEAQGSFGTIAGSFPAWVSKTDETRIQSVEAVLEELHGKPYYIATKLDGTSVSMGRWQGEFWVAGRNTKLKDDGLSTAWSFAHKKNLVISSIAWDKDYTIQGEFCGPGIQKNSLRLMEPEWYVFNVIDPEKNTRLPLDEMLEFCAHHGLTCVPVEERADSFEYPTVDSLLERAEGQYSSGKTKEGIVIRSTQPQYSETLRGDLSFKAINNRYLLKDEG
ncbi:MAG: RNA ligase (ATP) [Coriobacteriia bacterium]|nr:RNA ligase (ATP) [Coriobacteriia bacterium]MCL2750800.1 RNA ligase (ATP) [Coriobacteriia bacterium]